MTVHEKAFESAADFKAEITKPEYNDKLIIVDFTATWCGPCQAIKPALHDLATAEAGVVFFAIDVDDSDGASGELGISAMPTFHAYKNGNKVGEVVGASIDKLKALVATHK
ncbi:Aste57867_24054 [Aphanomyces stellatus]|uniref:Thioredoxin n=1 Tax=Aphanomyces stellatus TaxID=120398 RepID=A0A485LTS0_9STRA|nr:hypothetical protein As57867_023981 [Aphanomyces stellatus]VFU00697.1 Aste57867_24054 [Aphanomyces stellatus]